MRLLDGINNAVDMNLGKLQETVRVREAWCAAVYGGAKSWTHWETEQQQNTCWQNTFSTNSLKKIYVFERRMLLLSQDGHPFPLHAG